MHVHLKPNCLIETLVLVAAFIYLARAVSGCCPKRNCPSASSCQVVL